MFHLLAFIGYKLPKVTSTQDELHDRQTDKAVWTN